MNSRVPWRSDCAPVYSSAPLPGASRQSTLRGAGPLSCVQPSGLARRALGEQVSESHRILVWRTVQRGIPFNLTLILLPFPISISIAFHSSPGWQLITPICLCRLPHVCLPGFAICLRLLLPSRSVPTVAHVFVGNTSEGPRWADFGCLPSCLPAQNLTSHS